MIVAGWDSVQGGQVYAIPLGGMLYEAPYIIGGSGSIFLYSYFDREYQENMTANDCIDFVKEAIILAITRDGSSGGVARIAVITEDGLTRLGPQTVISKNTY
uniref:proteasome endopeptidase complex n=1 Tax=Henneguya salminicola TaxID=69463 RepID=A0A6G3MIA8_HENSL